MNVKRDLSPGEKISRAIKAAWAAGKFEHSRRRDPVFAKAVAAKSSQTKLAKRIEKKCPKCGVTWKEKPSHSWRVYCSLRCAGNAKRVIETRDCAFCGKKFVVNRRSPKCVTCSRECANVRHGMLMSKLGHTPLRYRDEKLWLASVQSEAHRQKVSHKHLGVRQNGESRRFNPRHFKAVEMFVRSPANVVYYVQNIRKFVAEHACLFEPDDVLWRKLPSGLPAGCRAANGLASLNKRIGTRLSWKGWTRVSNREGRDRFDVIGRNCVLSESPKPVSTAR